MPGAQPSGPGPETSGVGPVTPGWARAHGVAVVDAPDEPVDDQPGGVIYLGPLPHGPVRVLAGASAVLYRALVAHPEDPVAAVAAGLGVEPHEIDLEAIAEFADELVAAQLLVRRERVAPSHGAPDMLSPDQPEESP